jgi:hypothetical protein
MRTVSSLAAALLLCVTARAAAGENRFALIVSGAAGAAEYVEQYDRWSASLSRTLVDSLKFDPSHVTVLSDSSRADAASTADNVRKAVDAIARRMTRDDVLLIVLIGHGTFDGTDAKFNLVGPDLESSDWDALLKTLPGRTVLVNTSSASFPFLERLSAARRIVITSTDSPAQRYDTIFAEYFIRALADPAADLDKNDRISIWEAFAGASGSVRRHYQQRGQLSTEHALLDDNGDKEGTADPTATGTKDGKMAAVLSLGATDASGLPSDPKLRAVYIERRDMERRVEALRLLKDSMDPARYNSELEKLVTDIALKTREIRALESK